MTTRYVGKGGSDSADGLSWANRKLTLNGVEDTPVVAGDEIIVGPGIYREQLTCDVSGSSGNTIHYRGDPTGQLTDGIGGKVVITGMTTDVETVPPRDYCVYASSKIYREFSYLEFGPAAVKSIYFTNDSNGFHVHDCVFADTYEDGTLNMGCIRIFLSSGSSFTVERCIFDEYTGEGIKIVASSASGGGTRKIENCIFSGGSVAAGFNPAVCVDYAGDVYVRNCSFIGCCTGVYAENNGTTYTVRVYNCLFYKGYWGVASQTTANMIVEDYNSFFLHDSARSNVATGSNSDARTLFPKLPLLYKGFKLGPMDFFSPGNQSGIARLSDDGNGPSDDIWGIPRPTVNGKRSRGAIQHDVVERDTTTTYDSSPASLKMTDAGSKQFTVPVFQAPVAVSVRVYREANYAGTNPQVIIREAGQTARTTTDAGSAETWNQLTDEFTPQAGTEYITVELRSNNSATSGSYAAFFDAFVVTIEQ